MTKLIKVDLELPPFCEDLKFPSLCKGDYSKLYIYFHTSSTSKDRRMLLCLLLFFERSSEKFVEDMEPPV